MSISQAVSWYENLVDTSEEIEKVVLPRNEQLSTKPSSTRDRVVDARAISSNTRSFQALQNELVEALTTFNETGAEAILSEAFALYSLEEVGDKLITPVLVEIGQRWHDGQLSITREHYATGYLRQRLIGMLRSISADEIGPLIWVGCAPNELHEVGSILLCVYLRRAGFQVRYLGQNLPIDDLANEVEKNRPAMVLFSASTRETAETLKKMTEHLSNLGLSGLVIGYGGRIFMQKPELREDVTGIFMGSTAQEAVDIAKELL